MKSTFKLAALAVASAAVFTSIPATATPVSSLFGPGANTFADSSAEIAFRLVVNPSTGAVTQVPVTGNLQVGDYFLSAVVFEGKWVPSDVIAGNLDHELTALSLIKIGSIATVPNSQCAGALGCRSFDMVAPGAAVWGAVLGSFGVTAPAHYTNPGALSITNNTVAMFFESTDAPGSEFVRTGTIATGVQTASDGILRMIADLDKTTDVNDYWSATGPLSIATFAGAAGTKVGSFDFNGTISGQYFPGYQFDAEIIGDGTLRKSGNAGPTGDPTKFPIFDQSSVTVFLNVPEPGTLALLGLGLVGAAVAKRRKLMPMA